MKRIPLFIFLSSIIFLSNISYPQWKVTGGPTGSEVLSFLFSSGKLFSGTQSGLFSSVDSGKTGTKNTGLGNNDIKEVVKLGNDLIATTTTNIFKSTDNGNNWLAFTDGLPSDFTNSKILNFSGGSGDDHLGVFTDKGVYTTTNVSTPWQKLDDTWPTGLESTYGLLILGITIPFEANLNSVNSTAPFLFVTTKGGSVWRRQMDDIITNLELINDNIPEKYSLLQNYPNPFNPVTVISFQLPSYSKVSLKIYDVLGREIASLVNEEKPAGYYRINFDASKLSSGVYFYRIMAGEETI